MNSFNWIMSGLVSLLALVMAVKIFFFAMSVQDFITLVASLRRTQKAYFNNGRKYSDLIEARKLEQEVDQALKDGIGIPIEEALDNRAEGPEQGDQIGLFGE